MVTLEISNGVFNTLLALVAESGKTTQAVVEELIKKEDENRHIVWSRSQGKFVRHRCGLKNCQETGRLPLGDIAD